MDKAVAWCKAEVERISRDHRARNRQTPDFDLDNDRDACLHGVIPPLADQRINPSDIRRITQLFEKPSFFHPDGEANAADIHQGLLGDCWFLSGLASITAMKGLVEQLCVATELVGVYGFIFFRETSWVPVIIDDLLPTTIPKWEELSYSEQALYHYKKENFNSVARKGGQGLLFAKCGLDGQNETWVPLIEKAYAKLHGDYISLSGGIPGEAMEDLTGGVSTRVLTKDIMDPDRFWKEELSRVNTDRLFSCSLWIDSNRNQDPNTTVHGLLASHSYSVIRAVEVKGKRFVLFRNPWGATNSEWKGPWSDGSKEWTKEWLDVLPEIGHSFDSEDGLFVMEYSDFLTTWDQISRLLLFDATFVMSAHILQVEAQPLPSACSYGDVSFTINVPTATPAVIVLSKLDERYFLGIEGRSRWTVNFSVFKRGERHPIAEGTTSHFEIRGVNVEVGLDAGEYIVHVRIARYHLKKATWWLDNITNNESINHKKLSQVLTERAKSRSLASNFNAQKEADNIGVPFSSVAGIDINDLAKEAMAADERKVKNDKEDAEKALKDADEAAKETVSVTKVTLYKTKILDTRTNEIIEIFKEEPFEEPKTTDSDETAEKTKGDNVLDGRDDKTKDKKDSLIPEKKEKKRPKRDPAAILNALEDDQLFVCCRVYTKKDAPATVDGQLRDGQSYKNLSVEQKWWKEF
ncbi:hypothetical protein DL96DRAFT_1737658 [Flagelloscypha sp. PMI_526]|nr:hypothetical protein DL96DRAFT_1737658 [Flagelloscypha sp. PMI_526]